MYLIHNIYILYMNVLLESGYIASKVFHYAILGTIVEQRTNCSDLNSHIWHVRYRTYITEDSLKLHQINTLWVV